MANIKFFLAILILLLISTPLAFANPNTEIKIHATGTDKEDYQAKFLIINRETKQEIQGFSNLKELFINLDEGPYFIELLLNNEATRGYDYYGSKNFFASEQKNEVKIHVFPISTLEITTQYKNKKPISNVLVNVRCRNKYGLQEYFNTDDMGVLVIKELPIGKCVVRAAHKDEVLKEIINLKRGELKEINFKFQKEKNNNFLLTIFIIILLLAIYVILKKRNEPNKKVTKSKKYKEEQNEETSKERKQETKEFREDAFQVLNKKEKKIVEFLLEQENENIYQAKIVHATNIPKTTLAKILPLLEAKNIVEIEQHGKVKKVKLTPWFKKEDRKEL